MIINEPEFQALAEKIMGSLYDSLEKADAGGHLELEHEAGVMTITLPDGKQFVVSKHAPTRQIWLSSPVSGGLHFSYKEGAWSLEDGRALPSVLLQELKILSKVPLPF